MPTDDMIPKAPPQDVLGRYREIVSDPTNLLIERDKWAGFVRDGRLVLHNGNRVPLDGRGSYYGNFGYILVVNRGVHEPLEEFVFQEMLRHMPEAPVMIELGAYWAHYSMWMMKARPGARTIMVEPDAENLEGGRENFAANGYSGEFIQAFVGKDQWLPDVFLAARGIEHVDVLHVDIQGFEVEMLEHSPGAFAAHQVDYVVISTHGQSTHARVVALLLQHGYRIEAESDFADTTSFDGLVFAASPNAKLVFDGLVPFGRRSIATASSKESSAQLDAMRASIVGG